MLIQGGKSNDGNVTGLDLSTVRASNGTHLYAFDEQNRKQDYLVEATQRVGGVLLGSGNYANPTPVINSPYEHNETANRNAVGAHDDIYVRTVTLAEAIAEDAPVGTRYIISDRGNARFQSSPVGVQTKQFFAIAMASGRILEYIPSERKIINVLHAGAKDGLGEDATAEFQACMDYFSYGSVEIPASSTFRITATLINNTQFTLRGAEGGSVAFQSSRIYHDPASTGPLFSIENSTNGACIKNLYIYGGNGSPCIRSSIPQVRYEYLYMPEYNGGGIEFLGAEGIPSQLGTSTARVKSVQWVGPTSPTDYTGFHIDCNGGDVVLENCIAIRGAKGYNIRAGQTVQLLNCQANKQSTYNNYSSLPDDQTYGVGLTGSQPKEAVVIRGGYYEACTNLIVVDDVDSLVIDDNLLADVGVSGVVGAYEAFNHMIDIRGGKNIRIIGNKLRASSNGKQSTLQGYYPLRVGASAQAVEFKQNNINYIGDYSGVSELYAKVDWENNIVDASPSTPAPNIGDEFKNITNRKYDAWVSWNGSGGVSVNGSFGVVSTARDAVGEYTITTTSGFTNPIIVVSGENQSAVRTIMISVRQPTSNTFKVYCGSDANTAVDGRSMRFAIISTI